MCVCVFVWSYPHGNGFQYTQNIHGRILHKMPVCYTIETVGYFYVASTMFLFCSVVFGSKNCVYFRGLSFPCCHVIVCWLGCCFYIFQRVVKLFIFSFSSKTHIHTHTHTYICLPAFSLPSWPNLYFYINLPHPVEGIIHFSFSFSHFNKFSLCFVVFPTFIFFVPP